MSAMTTWPELAEAEAELADRVRACFAVRKHATLATVRRDGSPRISGTEVEFGDDGLCLGMMPGSLKARDLRRDPRLALHCPTEDPPQDDPSQWLGDAKVSGRAVELSDRGRLDTPHRFAVDVLEVVWTRVAPSGDRLLIDSWHPGRGVERRERR